MVHFNLLTVLTLALATGLSYVLYFRKRSTHGLPPGPRPLPVLGNILNLPPKGSVEYRHWLKLKEIYGPIMSLSVLGSTIIILHDRQAVLDLMVKESSVSSNRPAAGFACQICGYGEFLPLQQYDMVFRQRRKLINRVMGTITAAAQFNPMHEAEVARFLSHVVDRPDALFQHLETMVYGYSSTTKMRDPLAQLISQMVSHISRASVPFSWMIDIFPALRFLPESFPGASFKKTARAWRREVDNVANAPYSFAQKRMENQGHRPSFVSNLISQLSEDGTRAGLSPETESDIKWSAATMFLGGAESTVTTMTSFFLAMIMFPEVQRRGQEEIDRVVGTDRLPGFGDRIKLPFIDAIVKEVHRWSPVAPMALPHVTVKDQTYQNYIIPKGALLMPAVWWMLHDPKVYQDPAVFDPLRHLPPRNEPDPKIHAFGYGRRVCPGQYLTDAGLFLLISQTLAVFTISKAVDDGGREIEVELKVNPGIFSKVLPFAYKIAPRSAGKGQLAHKVASMYTYEEGESELLQLSKDVFDAQEID